MRSSDWSSDVCSSDLSSNVARSATSSCPQGKPVFRFRWGHDDVAERATYEDVLDWMAGHLERNPGAHVYHYAPYEVTALRRLSTYHASRECTLDALLRQRRFVEIGRASWRERLWQ